MTKVPILCYPVETDEQKERFMLTIRVPDQKNSHPYWPDALRAAAYVGSLTVHEGVVTLVIPKPNAKNSQIARDLRNLAEYFQHRGEVEGA